MPDLKSIFASCLVVILGFIAVTPVNAVQRPQSSQVILQQAKNAYFNALEADLNKFIGDAASLTLKMPPQGQSSTTLNYDSDTDHLQATLKTDYKIDSEILKNIRATDSAAEVLRLINASLTIDLDATLEMPSFGMESSRVAVSAEAWVQNGVIYFRVSRLESDNEMANDFLTVVEPAKWQKFDFVAGLVDRDAEINMYDLGRSIMRTDSVGGFSALLDKFVEPSEEGTVLIQNLLSLYLKDVWQSGSIFSIQSINSAEAELIFGPSNLQNLANRHINFLIGNYDRVRGTLLHSAPFAQFTLALPTSKSEARKMLAGLRSEIAKNLPDFAPLQIKANFGSGRVEFLNLVHTWQKPEYSWDSCFTADRDYSVACEPDEIQRNFHINFFYAPNEPGRLDDDLASLLLATRLTGDPEPATLKLTSEQNAIDANIIDHTLQAVWPKYKDAVLNAVYRLDAKVVTDFQTKRVLETTASFLASLPNEPNLTRAQAKLMQKLDWPINQISLQLSSTPASALSASLEYLGNRQEHELSLQATYDLLGQKTTATLQEQFTSDLARPIIVVPAAALQAE